MYLVLNNVYQSCNIVGSGKIFIKDIKKAEKFKIVEMSAEKIKIETDSQLELDTIVHLKIILNSILFNIYIDAKGKVIEKNIIEFMGLSDKVKKEIDEIIGNACS